MMTTTVTNLSEDTGRIFEISVTGSTQQARLRTSTYKIRVSYSTLSTTIRSIAQRGGKIVDVKMLSMFETEIDRDLLPAVAQLSQPITETVESIPAATEVSLPIDTLDIAQPVVAQPTVKPTNNRPAAARSKHSKSKKR
jgi:DUF1009 family protein